MWLINTISPAHAAATEIISLGISLLTLSQILPTKAEKTWHKSCNKIWDQ